MIRQGVVAVIFRRTRTGSRFLLLRRKLHWTGWELLKGGKNPRESSLRALKREVSEETGIRKIRANNLHYVVKYAWDKPYEFDGKIFDASRQQAFLVEVFSSKIRVDPKEHDGYKWVSAQNAAKLLTWPDQRALLSFAQKTLNIYIQKHVKLSKTASVAQW